MAINASYFPVAVSFFAASGNSNAPGTCTTSTSLPAAPARSSASTAAARSRSVIKLLNRLTTSAKRRPSPFSPPSNLCGSSFPAISPVPLPLIEKCVSQSSSRSPLLLLPHSLSFKLRRPLLQKCLCPFAHVFRRARQFKQRCFEKQSFFLRHLHATLDRFHDVLGGERRVRDDLFRQSFGCGQKFRRFINVVHESDAPRLFRADHFS